MRGISARLLPQCYITFNKLVIHAVKWIRIWLEVALIRLTQHVTLASKQIGKG